MDTNPLKTFEIERARLLRENKQALSKLSGNLSNVNQNIQTINSIAAGFHEPSNLWHEFHKTLKGETKDTGAASSGAESMDTRS
ncbi:hypothetical protein BDB00DRAFT_497248 [Zychaea mexicana]|uniref:uncharacterized protein n=1 Tax=Zychaea mexicana TaxID=64656 RepID=UPI0022FE87F5|nr:uncharacterized protein BDB00DRAFT_497248 [Zychaea mexicana]KAI9498070.1 hypothetical protein BDB00DRAFT_497248 [Zychaea mexicana]